MSTVSIQPSLAGFDRRVFYAIVTLIPAGVALISIDALAYGAVTLLFCAAILFQYQRPERIIFLLFTLVAWFPEYSQSVDVWSAEDFRSLYNFRPIPWVTASVFDYVFVLATLIWFFYILVPRRNTIIHLPLVKYMLLFLGASALSLILGLAKGYESYYVLREFRVSAYFVLMFLMWITTVDNDEKRQDFVRLLLGVVFLVGAYGVVRYALGMGKEYYGTHLIYYDIADSMALYLGIFIIIALWYAYRKRQFALACLCFPMIFTLIFSYRRGAWIAFAIGCLALLKFHPKAQATITAKKRRWILALAVCLLVGTGIFATSSDASSLFLERVQSIADTQEDPSNVFRIMDTLNALTTFARHPVLGVGFGGRYDLEYYSAALAPEEFWDSVDRASHNGYLFILYKMGVIGFLAYMGIFWHFAKLWFRARRDLSKTSIQQTLFYGCGATVLALLVNNITSPVTDSLRPSLLLAVAMACAINFLPQMTADSIATNTMGYSHANKVQEFQAEI